MLCYCLPTTRPKAAPWRRKLPTYDATRPTAPRLPWRRKRRFPCSDAGLPGPGIASRLPQDIEDAIRQHGIRNSHLLSVAPTGTVSLAFADNASNGVEPPFSWTYTRRKREADGSKERVPGGRPRLALVPCAGGDVQRLPACTLLSARWRCRRRPCGDDGGGAAVWDTSF